MSGNGKAVILVIEDDAAIQRILSTVLGAHGYGCLLAGSGADALSMAASHCPDLVLLDLGLPDMDGMEVLAKIRAWSAVPVLVVSARWQEREKVRALDAGADDYITKPFGTSELMARVRTALRHAIHAETEESAGYAVGGLWVDRAGHRVTVDGRDLHLTQIEFKIVSLLAANAGRVLTYDYIIKHIWGPYADSDNRILRVNMANIRRKIEANPAEPRYILTEVGVGYRMASDERVVE